MKITGTMLWYYFTCKRELWFFGNGINMDYDSEFINIGKQIDKSNEKFEFEGGKIDSIKITKNKIVVEETKKSNKLGDKYKWQIKYYLYLLMKKGVKASGEIIYKENKEKEVVNLTKEDISKIEEALKEIPKIVLKNKPPKPVRKPYCKNCAYYSLCWVGEDEK